MISKIIFLLINWYVSTFCIMNMIIIHFGSFLPEWSRISELIFLLRHSNVFTVLEAEKSKIKVPADSVSSESPFPDS